MNFEKDANAFGSQGRATNSTHQNLSNQGAAKESTHHAFQRGGFRALGLVPDHLNDSNLQ